MRGGWIRMSRRPKGARTTSLSITNCTSAQGRGMRIFIRCGTQKACRRDSRRRRTRSACSFCRVRPMPGSQRLGVTAWSGDVLSDWETFQAADSGGVELLDLGDAVLDDRYWRIYFRRELERSEVPRTVCALVPVWRVLADLSVCMEHEIPDENELWSYGPEAQKILVDYDNLRYRLLPYIYSQAWQVTSNHGTLMRPLVMDWREDVDAQNIGDEYLFGPAILVSPVTTQGATSRSVYLPKATWYDFWTGSKIEGGKYIDAEAPLEKLPLYVRAGSIVPMGPTMEWSTQKPADPIEIRVYPGANGDFTLYEDENDNYDYAKGQHATIRLHWDDAEQDADDWRTTGQLSGDAREAHVQCGGGWRGARRWDSR